MTIGNQRQNAPAHLPSGSFGFTKDQWGEAKREIREQLIAAAREQRMISYSDLADAITLPLEAHDVRFSSLLGEVSGDEHQQGRPLLSVLVVHKSGDMQPGPGFFELAKSLGEDTSDMDSFWVEEFTRVYKYWAVD